MATEDKRLSNGSYNAGIGHDSTASNSLPTSTSRESIAYRQHMRKESQARERAQHDALMDTPTPTSTPAPAQPVNPGNTGSHDHHHDIQDRRSSSQPGGFTKLLQKIGLKK